MSKSQKVQAHFSEATLKSTLHGLGIAHCPTLFSQLFTAYRDAGRHYHGTQHVAECLALLTKFRRLAIRPCENEMAIWFHDAVYDTHQSDNEEQSANCACEFLTRMNVAKEIRDRVITMILATKHHESADSDAALVADIDLSILSAPSPVLDRYDAAIRQEYQWVPEPDYRQARAKALSAFVKRKRICHRREFHEVYADQAKINLPRKVAELLVDS